MSPEDFQIDGDIKMSALLLMKKNYFFFEDVFRSMSTWAQLTRGKVTLVKDCCLRLHRSGTEKKGSRFQISSLGC